MFDSWKWQSRLKQVNTLLDREREFLLSGKADRVAALEASLREATDLLLQIPAAVAKQSGEEIHRLNSKAQRNRKLLEAYLEGARMGATRVAELGKTVGELGAYKPDGSKIGTTRSTLNCTTKA